MKPALFISMPVESQGTCFLNGGEKTAAYGSSGVIQVSGKLGDPRLIRNQGYSEDFRSKKGCG